MKLCDCGHHDDDHHSHEFQDGYCAKCSCARYREAAADGGCEAVSEETCRDCGLPKWTDSGSKQEFGTCMAHLDQAEPEEIIACRDRELAKLRPTPERFYRWWSTLTQEQRTNCWYDLDALAHPEVVSSLKAELAAATARASELETALVKADQNLAGLVAKRDAELSALGERVARAELQLKALDLLCGLVSEEDGTVVFRVLEGGQRHCQARLVPARGDNAGRAALDLATKLGLLQPETKGKTELPENGRPLMQRNEPPDRCPVCNAPEVEALTPRTTYACGSSDYDQRPGTFINKCGPT